MKFRVNRTYKDGSFDVITEDGGVASVHHNGSNYVTTYYGMRLTDCDPNNYVWDELSAGKSHFKDWDEEEPLEIDMILDALGWLVVPNPKLWEHYDDIWTEFFPIKDLKECLLDTLSESHWFSYGDENIGAFKDALEEIIFRLEEIDRKKLLNNPDDVDAVSDANLLLKTILVHI